MSTLAQPLAAPGGRPFALRDAVLGLARIEAIALVRHPLVLAGAALSIAFSISFSGATDIGGDYLALSGVTLLPLALATLVAANLAALRSRRSRTGELYSAAPAPPQARTLAHLLAIGGPTALAVLLVAVGFAYFRAWTGLDIAPDGRVATPSLSMLQGPLAVAVCGALGVALARVITYAAAGSVAAVGLLVLEMPYTMWNLQGGLGWLLPLVNPHRLAPGVDSSWPCAIDQAWPCVFGELAPLGWHLTYLAALGMLFAAVALLREGRKPPHVGLAAVAALVALIAGTVQLP